MDIKPETNVLMQEASYGSSLGSCKSKEFKSNVILILITILFVGFLASMNAQSAYAAENRTAVIDGVEYNYGVPEPGQGPLAGKAVINDINSSTKTVAKIPDTLDGYPVAWVNIASDHDLGTISSFELTNCNSLTGFYAYSGGVDYDGSAFSDIVSVKATNCPELQDLKCHGATSGALKTLTVSNCPNISWVVCMNNELTTLDLSGCPKLHAFECQNNKLSSLNISGCNNLWKLCVQDNRLTTLDISAFSSVEQLYCENNYITNTAVLEKWLAQEGHQGTVLPQKETEALPSNPDTPVQAGKWIHGSKGWWYSYNDGTYAKGFQVIDSKTYYFDTNGWMKTGWQKIDDNWYYFKSSGVMSTGWVKVGNTWYFMNNEGIMQTGKIVDQGKTYFLTSSGAMKTGWVKDGSDWYYCNKSGALVTGWVKVKNTWYFMNAEGVMQTGKITDKSKTYFLSSSGAMKTGWVKDGSKWYYTNKSGAMVTGWQKVKSKWYYLNPTDGVMLTGKKTIDGNTYFLASSGAMKTGWNKEGSDWFFYNKSGAMQVSKWIGNYYVDSDGVMATNSWVDNGKYYVNTKGEWVPNAQH